MKSPSTLAPETLDRWAGVIPIKPLLIGEQCCFNNTGRGGVVLVVRWWYLQNGKETVSEAPRNEIELAES